MNTFDFQVNNILGEAANLSLYRGKVLLIVNTASKCGFTPQYKGLEHLFQRFKDKGLIVLGFPCNQFRQQEPGSTDEISLFCQMNYNVTFPMFSKIKVNGKNAHPLFRHLKKSAKGILGTEMIKWNFTKFLVSKDGSVFKRYAPSTTPEELFSEIEKLLDA